MTLSPGAKGFHHISTGPLHLPPLAAPARSIVAAASTSSTPSSLRRPLLRPGTSTSAPYAPCPDLLDAPLHIPDVLRALRATSPTSSTYADADATPAPPPAAPSPPEPRAPPPYHLDRPPHTRPLRPAPSNFAAAISSASTAVRRSRPAPPPPPAGPCLFFNSCIRIFSLPFR